LFGVSSEHTLTSFLPLVVLGIELRVLHKLNVLYLGVMPPVLSFTVLKQIMHFSTNVCRKRGELV
jgi:hypothetical protein